MHVSKWGNSLAIRIPNAVAEALELKEGDEVEITIVGDRQFRVDRDRRKAKALETLQRLARPFPPGWRFDREEATERRTPEDGGGTRPRTGRRSG